MAFVCQPEPHQQLSKTKTERRLAVIGTSERTLGDILGSSRTTFMVIFTVQSSLASYCSLPCLSLIHLMSVRELLVRGLMVQQLSAVLNDVFTH